jgi:hypothetical protein
VALRHTSAAPQAPRHTCRRTAPSWYVCVRAHGQPSAGGARPTRDRRRVERWPQLPMGHSRYPSRAWCGRRQQSRREMHDARQTPPHAIHHVLVCSDDSCERAYSSILNQPRVCEEILVESAGACRESSAFVHTVCRSGGDTHGAWRRAALSRARGDGSVASGTGEQQKIKHSLNTKTETTPRPRRYSQCTAVHTKHRRRVKK